MQTLIKFSKNEVGSDYVVGDIHGKFDLLEEALREVNFNRETDRLFSVGDLVDRGPDSEACLLYLDQPWFHAVRGNHEQMAIEFNEGKWGIQSYCDNGGLWFFRATTEERKRFIDAFENMPYAFEVETEKGRVGIVHAEVPDDDWETITTYPLSEIADTLIWSRAKYRARNTTHVKNIDRVLVGHTVVKEPIALGNVWYIDTGAVFYDNLTIVRL